ncbi:MAG: adenylate/guanylate cyclase domain-containing protein [Casimicrobiaceae bacterium]
MVDVMSSARGPERRQLTVMFCDIVESTALSLRLDPEELADVIQAYRQHCTSIILRHDGVVARLIGDGILAYFGYPRAHENDAERAIRAALNIAGTEWSTLSTADLKVHIGVATGLVVVGDLPDGGESLAAIGNAPNLAARLEALAGPGEVVVSEQTRRLTGRLFDYHDLGRQNLKGFDEPMPAWRVIGERKVGSRFHALRATIRTPLVNRVAELQELRRLWEATKAGQGQALLIVSEPGVGKSRLTEVLAERIVEPGCLRVWYHCSPNLQSSPLAPVIRQFAIAAGFAEHDDDATRLRKLETLVPKLTMDAPGVVALLANLLSVRIEGEYAQVDMSPQRQKRRLFQILMQSLAAFAASGPFLLVVEDLHWIDPTSDELIGVLIDRLSDLPILVILTARPEFQSHWEDKDRLHQLNLKPLDRNDTVTMINSICGDEKLPASAVAQIAERTDGLPLFIEDLTRDVLEGSPVSIPTTLNDSLMSRLDRLGSAKAVAETAAVIGREFSYELLVKIADLPEEHVREELRRLVDAGLLVSGRSSAVLGYAFRHALVRDAAYSNLLKKKQVVLHGRIAKVIIGDFPETAESQPEVVAYHLQVANELDGAVDFLVRAAKVSARRSGFVEALADLDQALALLGRQARSVEVVRRELGVYRALGGIYAEYRGFSSAECGGAYTKALDLCRELGDTPEIFAVLAGLGSFEITRAGFARCRALAEECLSRATAQAAKPPFIMGHLLLGGTLFLQGELADARKHLEEALQIYDEDRAPRRGKQVLYVQDQKSTGLCYLALTLTIMGEVDQGVLAGETGLAHARSLGGLHTINFSLCYLAAALYIRGDIPAALRCATESLASAREQGFATWIGVSQIIRGAALARSGQIDEGLAELDLGMGAHAGMQATAYQPFALALWAEGLLAADRHGEALDALGRALAISETTGERFYAAELWRLKGEAMAKGGNLEGARGCLHEAIEVARRQNARLFELRSVQVARALPAAN